jgi:carbamoyltransferase
VANGKVLRAGRFKNIWIQPAAGDAGGAVGAALAAYHIHKNPPRKPNGPIDGMKGAYLGPRFDQSDVENRLKSVGAKFETYCGDELLDRTVKALIAGKAVGWFQGRMEFRPRALGNRSILGDARSPTMQSLLNLKVK